MDLANVYVLKCADGSYYAGMSRSFKHRVQAQRRGKGARYVSRRLPATLVWFSHLYPPHRAVLLERRVRRVMQFRGWPCDSGSGEKNSPGV